MTHGLTLTSLMVAVALSGVLAVAGTRLVVNQMNTLRVMELREKGDSIFRFYSNLLHDDKVWWCTLYDGTPAAATPNKAMRDCVLGGATCPSGEQAMRLMGPDCTIKFTDRGTRDFSTGNFTVGTEFIGTGGKSLKDSAMQAASGGWWNVKITWEHRSNRAVDLILTQTFNKSRWQNAPAGDKRYLPNLQAGVGTGRKLRVRRSTNYAPSNSDRTRAVIGMHQHTIGRSATHHSSPLVDTTPSALGGCHNSDPKGQVVKSTTACSGNRVAVTPTNCGTQSSVIDRIGDDPTLSAGKNIGCALDGDGKMVRYRACGRAYYTRDECTVNGQSFTAWKYYVPSAITGISSSGTLVCKALPSWPTVTSRTVRRYPFTTSARTYTVYGQGDIGPKGDPGTGPRGPRGYPWNDSRCS